MCSMLMVISWCSEHICTKENKYFHILDLLLQTFCKLQLLQQLLMFVAEAVILLRTGALKKKKHEIIIKTSCDTFLFYFYLYLMLISNWQ